MVAPGIKIILQTLVKSEIKQASIGQCIVKATRSRSCIPPLQLGLGVELDHVFWVKMVNYKVIGFCVSPDEVLLYKQSAVQAEPVEISESDCYPSKFTQWVGDNLDHN